MNKKESIDRRMLISNAIDRLFVIKSKSNYYGSKLSGLTATQIKEIRNGETAFTTDSLIAILDVFGVNLVEILQKETENV